MLESLFLSRSHKGTVGLPIRSPKSVTVSMSRGLPSTGLSASSPLVSGVQVGAASAVPGMYMGRCLQIQTRDMSRSCWTGLRIFCVCRLWAVRRVIHKMDTSAFTFTHSKRLRLPHQGVRLHLSSPKRPFLVEMERILAAWPQSSAQ